MASERTDREELESVLAALAGSRRGPLSPRCGLDSAAARGNPAAPRQARGKRRGLRRRAAARPGRRRGLGAPRLGAGRTGPLGRSSTSTRRSTPGGGNARAPEDASRRRRRPHWLRRYRYATQASDRTRSATPTATATSTSSIRSWPRHNACSRPRERRWPAKHDNILFCAKDAARNRFRADDVEPIPYMVPSSPVRRRRREAICRPTSGGTSSSARRARRRRAIPRRSRWRPRTHRARILAAVGARGRLRSGQRHDGEAALRHGRRFVLTDGSSEAVAVMMRRFTGEPGVAFAGLRGRLSGAGSGQAAARSCAARAFREVRWERLAGAPGADGKEERHGIHWGL